MAQAPARSRALDKAVSTLESGDFYEAQQLFKSIYHRQRGRKLLQESYSTLQQGAELQLHQGHVTCGVELGLMLVEAYTSDKVSQTMDNAAPLLSIMKAFPDQNTRSAVDNGSTSPAPAGDADTTQGPGQVNDVEEYSRLVAAIVTWGNKQPQLACTWTSQVHDIYATYLWQYYGTKHLQRVALHVIRSGNVTLHAEVLSKVAAGGHKDVFITQAILQVLAIARPHTKEAQLIYAKELLRVVAPTTASSGSLDASQPVRAELHWPPLCNFCGLLLEAIDRKSLPLVRLLRDRYGPSLSQDTSWTAYLTRIESVYLGARDNVARGGGLGGLLQGLLQGMNAEADDVDESEEVESG